MKQGDKVKVTPKTLKGKNRIANGIGDLFIVSGVEEKVAFSADKWWACLVHPEGNHRQQFWVRIMDDQHFDFEFVD